MSFNKTVNGVTFTSDNFTNIDVSFDKKGYFTYIYISTTDNQDFNNDTLSNYHIVHDDINLGVTNILLQNNNKTAKLYVHTRDFTEYNSYNIQQLPLTETGKTQETDTTQETGKTQETDTTQKLVDHSENGYKVYIPSDCTSLNGGRTRPNYTGYEVVPQKGLTLNSDIVKTIYADVNGDNNNRVQGTLDGNNIKFIFSDIEWSVLNYSRVRDTKGNLIYNLQDYVKQIDGKTESIKPYTLADVKLKCNDENATLKVTNNTATLTATSGYKIVSASITSKKHNIFQEKYNFTISKDGSNATITLTPSKELDYDLKVSTEEKPSEPQPQPSQPETKKFNGSIVLNNDVKDKIKFDFDNQITVKISVTDNKYNINSLYYLYQPYMGANLEKSSNGFTINADKKTATLVIPDNVIVPDDTSYVFKLKIGGDIADTTPLEPETATAKTQRVYMVDDKGLSELTKQAEKYFNGSTNTNYDFTEFINQLYYLPFTVDENLSDPTNKIDTGLWSLNAPAREMKDRVLNIDLGTININPENNNGFDYNIESIKLYLPLVLPVKIDFQDCYKKTISINYKINLLNGNATINISSNDKIISTFNQNVQTNLQMFNIYNNKDFGSLNNSIINELLTPYIKVNYYKPVENLVSYETLEHNNLSSYTNFVKTRNASVSCGTQEEQQEIETLLNGGIYIK